MFWELFQHRAFDGGGGAGGADEAGKRFEGGFDDARFGIRRSEHRIEHVAAVLVDAGAVVRARNHAENDAGIVAAADVVRVGVRAVAAHSVKRQLRVRRENRECTVQAVDVVRAGQDEGRKLEQERQRRHRVVLRERTSLEHHGFELLHDRIGLFELAEKAEVGIFSENRLAVVVGVLIAQRRKLPLDERMERVPVEAVFRIVHLKHAERYVPLRKARVFADFKHCSILSQR